MIEPPLPSASMRRAADLQPCQTPRRLTRTFPSAASSVIFSGIIPGPRWAPALLTMMSTRPPIVVASPTTLSISAGTQTSQRTATARPPSRMISAATSASRSSRRAASTTVAPARASALAKITPQPDDAPVTTAVLPVRSNRLRSAFINCSPASELLRDGEPDHARRVIFGADAVGRLVDALDHGRVGQVVGPESDGPVLVLRRELDVEIDEIVSTLLDDIARIEKEAAIVVPAGGRPEIAPLGGQAPLQRHRVGQPRRPLSQPAGHVLGDGGAGGQRLKLPVDDVEHRRIGEARIMGVKIFGADRRPQIRRDRDREIDIDAPVVDHRGVLRGHDATDARVLDVHRSEERRVGKECRSRWSPYH